MKNSNLTSYLFALLLLSGTFFIVQCDGDTRQTEAEDQYQTEQDITIDEEDRRYDGTGEAGIADDQIDLTMDYVNRDTLVEKLEELRDDLDSKRDEVSGDSDEESQQLQNDRSELERMIGEVETATEDNWNDVRKEAIQTYESIAARYNENSSTDTNPD